MNRRQGLALWFILAAPAMATGCGDTVTPISKIQGTGTESSLVDQVHTVEGMVTAVFTGEHALEGFFVQEEPSDYDNDPRTSEGLFIFDRSATVKAGQTVRITGTVKEFHGLTELTRVSNVQVRGEGAQLNKPAPLQGALGDPASLEAMEGMRVSLTGRPVVTANDSLVRYGQFAVSQDRRLYVPTQVAAPGGPAAEVSDRNAGNRLVIDDGSTQQFPRTVIYPPPQLSAQNTLRVGQRLENATGVLSFGFGEYRLHLTSTLQLTGNTRPPPLPKPDDGIRIASFNLQNFFNGDGTGNGFPTARGADSPLEYRRQRTKLAHALAGLNAAIIGLVEVENDGYGTRSAVADLVAAVNKESEQHYRYITAPTSRLGDDQITVGIIYDKDAVRPQGPARTMDDGPFGSLNRQPLAQNFYMVGSQALISVAVNHFKSKNCANAQGPNKDQNDGQGCYNQARTAAATTLSEWLKEVSGTPYMVILGDLNSYANETPLQVFAGNGFINALAPDAYTFNFQGQSGTLDYALFSRALKPAVVKTGVWHINADEPQALDYNTEQKTAAQVENYFTTAPYRSADHDPVYLTLKPTNLRGRTSARR